jgi:hypothetical protein
VSKIHVQWSEVVDSSTGQIIQGEFTATVKGWPRYRLHANRWSWRVVYDGVLAREQILTDPIIERAIRRRGGPIERVTLSKMRAEAWVKDVIEQAETETR